jgi:hypothetical protein
MRWLATVSVEVVKDAFPDTIATVPKDWEPSIKVTVPVGCCCPVVTGNTMDVSVRASPAVIGSALDVSEVVVAELGGITTWVSTADVLLEYVLLPA